MRSVQSFRENMVDISTVEMRKRFNEFRKYTLDEILADICLIFEEDIDKVKSSRRHGNLVKVRTIFSFVAQSITNRSLLEISIAIGGHEHTKALHHIQKARGFMKVQEPKFMEHWEKYITASNIWKYCSKK